jgi:ribosomal protein S18 acetylase RimI-like enzyme
MPSLELRPILAAERDSLVWWIDHAPFVHIHVGWLNPARWVGRPVSLHLADRHGRTQAALLACPDGLRVAWIQSFACSRKLAPSAAWQTLWEAARQSLHDSGIAHVWAMSSEASFAALLLNSGFQPASEVVTLTYRGGRVLPPACPPGVTLRAMAAADVPAVLKLDQSAFQAPWQMDDEAMQATFAACAAATVAVDGEAIVGYLLATQAQGHLHLARLATAPNRQRTGVGRALTLRLIKQVHMPEVISLTVNTQTENLASLRLYRALGFREGGQTVPVYRLDLRPGSASSSD